eukprot:SAG11_NODE_27410_length_333_cov_0.653846_1_plen_56_part_01
MLLLAMRHLGQIPSIARRNTIFTHQSDGLPIIIRLLSSTLAYLVTAGTEEACRTEH